MKNRHKYRAYPLLDGWAYKTIIMHDCRYCFMRRR